MLYNPSQRDGNMRHLLLLLCLLCLLHQVCGANMTIICTSFTELKALSLLSGEGAVISKLPLRGGFVNFGSAFDVAGNSYFVSIQDLGS